MEFLVLWLGTSVASFCIEVANELRMLKDVADEGYKVDSNRLSELSNQINPDMSKNVFLSMLIPFYNVAQVLQRTMEYNNARPMVLDQLRIMDALEEMSEYEKEEYQKNPTGLNAFLVPIKNKIRFEKATSIKFTNEEGVSTIYYDFDKSNDEIVIIKVTGPYSKLTVEEQKRKVMDAWGSILKAGEKEYGDVETFINTLKNNPGTDVNLSETKEEQVEEQASQTTKELTTAEKKQALENLRSELLQSNVEETEEVKEEQGPRLIKK